MSRVLRVFKLPVSLVSLVVGALLLLVGVLPLAAETGADYAISEGWFFTQTGGGSGRGYAVRDQGAFRFWTEFRRLGGIDALGYPIGQLYVGSDGFTYQAFQRGILQWRPEAGRAVLSNTFESLQASGKDDWLLATKGVPKAIADDGSAGDFNKAIATRLGWLTNDAIKAKYLANPNPGAISGWTRDSAIERYGLPMSQPERIGPYIVQRFQRVAFQLWMEDVPGMPARGSIVGILAGDLMKEAGLLPSHAQLALGPGGIPVAEPTATPQPAATPTPALPTYAWRVSSVQGWPNCGTTYIRAYVRDANGNGVNGMTLKSWNDWGNEYEAGTRSDNDRDGYWDRVVSSGPSAGKWYVALLDGSGQRASDVAVASFTDSCDTTGGVQEVELEFRPSATSTEPAPTAVAPQPTAAIPQATASPAQVPSGNPWRVSSVQGWPNCGTTYIRAYVRDANGNGVNGMTLKSWNDWGNEYEAGTRNDNDRDGYWDRVVSSGPSAGRWYVALLDGAGQRASDVAEVNFTGSCDAGGVQEVELEFRPR